MASSSSSMPKPRSGWTYDVFLSFRGEDTRNTFVDHLYAALVQRGIHTFKDNLMLGAGKPISQELVKAIQKSMFAVVVLSKNYANSSWCLEELVKIMECQDQTGHKVLPVFYHVDPSDVREQNGSFATAFQEHENKFKGDMYLLRETANLSNVRGQKRDFATAFEQHEEMDKVKKWREALTAAASLTGYHVSGINGLVFFNLLTIWQGSSRVWEA